jgi:3-oxoacyl-[acyl-carrier-protein] synthase-3
MPCYITQTGSFLPGPVVANADIERYLGTLDGEAGVKEKVLAMNGIVGRHYAQDQSQHPTYDVYQLGTNAAINAFREYTPANPISYLSAGTTYAPLSGPGIASLLHDRLSKQSPVNSPVEVSSHAGICTSASAALVGAIRAVKAGEHDAALCIGTEHASEVLKAAAISPIDDRQDHEDLRKTQWFMTVFLRFMLSDGAGAFILENQPKPQGLSLRVNWTHSQSFAHETPLCMKLENKQARLSQDITILSRHLVPTARKFLTHALQTHGDQLDTYKMILPHMSSYFFRRKMERVLQDHFADPEHAVPYWTNLATVGNTGAASIYIMLDQYLRENRLQDGDKLILFIPESGQFNFVLISVTAVIP